MFRCFHFDFVVERTREITSVFDSKRYLKQKGILAVKLIIIMDLQLCVKRSQILFFTLECHWALQTKAVAD